MMNINVRYYIPSGKNISKNDYCRLAHANTEEDMMQLVEDGLLYMEVQSAEDTIFKKVYNLSRKERIKIGLKLIFSKKLSV